MTRTVVLVSIDSLRADHCSTLGYDRETTPRLTDAVADGRVYERCYAQSSHTRESMPSLLYGVYPPRLDAVGHAPADRSSIASVLAGEGWATAGFHSNPYLSRAYGFDEGFGTFDDSLPLATNRVTAFLHRVRNYFSTEPYTRAGELNDRALTWLADRDDPAFVWLHYMDPHGPYQPPPEYQRLFRDDVVDADTAKRLWRRSVDEPESLSEADVDTLVDLYDAEIRYTDAMLGELLDELARRDEETVVAVASDHGELFGEGGRYGHPRRVDEELVRVPLAFVGDGVDDGADGGRVDRPVENVDVVPTLLDVAGVESGDSFDGASLLGETTDGTAFSVASGEGEESKRFRAALRDRTRVASGVWTVEGDCVESSVEPLAAAADSEATDGRATEEQESDADLLAELRDVLAETGATGRSGDAVARDDAQVDQVVTDRLEELGYR